MQASPDCPSADNYDDYWDSIASQYQRQLRISCCDFHFGPLLPGDRQLRLLPPVTDRMKCLELGCGGAQNSIFLARQGACCKAVDKSIRQLALGRRLARENEVEIEFLQADLDQWEPDIPNASLELVHSSYCFPFLRQPGRLVSLVAPLIRPGGWLLFSTAHPLANAERIETEEGERGVFVQDYFSVTVDQRVTADGQCEAISRSWPLSEMASWLTEQGLMIHRLLEPKPVPPEEWQNNPPPYDGEKWREYYRELEFFPAVIIFLAYKPKD